MTTLASKICDEIQISGAISFARFMELALYSPELGYYEGEEQIGRRGDFFTSVSVGSLFGELLAFQFAAWFEQHETKNKGGELTCLHIIEAGAHNGQLASDILHWLKKFRPEIFKRSHYYVFEPSPRYRDWQRKTLDEYSDRVSWCAGWSDFPHSAIGTPHFKVVFSNELFDAMPVHRFGWDAKAQQWFEWGVGWAWERFSWKRLLEVQRSTVPPPQVDPDLLAVLPDGFITEICPSSTEWWKNAADVLDAGKLLAIDYGLLAEDFLIPERSNGTARAYFQHRINPDLLARPGEQDITAHVNFSALQKTGENAGLKTDTIVSQAKFLTEIAARFLADVKSNGEWDGKRRKQFQTLTHPEHLGRPFRVLVQSR